MKSRATVSERSDDADPALFGQRRALTRLTSSSQWPLSTPCSAASVSSRVSRSAIRPKYSTSTRSTLEPSRQRHRQPRQPVDERDKRSQHIQVLGRDRRDVDRGRDHAACQRRHDLLGRLHPGAILRLGRRGTQMRRHDHIRITIEERIVRDRLGREYIQRRARDLARIKRRLQRRIIDQLATRAIDDPHPITHLRERVRIQPTTRLRRLRQMQRDEIRLRIQLRRRLGPLDTQLAKALAPTQTDQTPRSASRTPAHAPPPTARSAQSPAPQASSRKPRRHRTATAPNAPPSATRAPAAHCAPTPASTPACAPPPPQYSTAARSQPRSHAWSPPPHRHCRPQSPPARSPANAPPARSTPHPAASPSGSRSRR